MAENEDAFRPSTGENFETLALTSRPEKANGKIKNDNGENLEPLINVGKADNNEGENEQTNLSDNAACARQREKCRACCTRCSKQFLADGRKPEAASPWSRKLLYAVLCPPHGRLGRLLSVILLAGVSWTSAWCILGESLLPGGNIFALLILLILCHISGCLVKCIKLPPLLGMLIMGGLLRNIPTVNIAKDIDSNWSTCIRSTALVVILLRAGLGLDPSSLRKLSFVVLRLAFTPCLIEGAAIAVAAHPILGFPWAWGALQGLVIGAVTPAVVVPCILSLSDRGYGVERGIPTLVIAASSIDDVLAITGFSLTLGFVFGGSGNLADTITKGPREVLLGIVLGLIYGALLWYLPTKKMAGKRWFRLELLTIGGLVFMFGSDKANFPSAGAIGCLTLAFVAAYRWRLDSVEETEDIDKLMERVWFVAEPFMFGLIGAEIDVTTLDLPTVGLGVAVLGIGLVFRMMASFLVVFGTELTLKEKLFIVFAWLPKATVQAAIGPLAYDTAVRSNGTPLEKQMGLQILTLAVMSIILTAPIGGALILLTATITILHPISQSLHKPSPPFSHEHLLNVKKPQISLSKKGPKLLSRQAIDGASDGTDKDKSMEEQP